MASQSKKNNILVAPLNWGLGHAARCIPVIDNLISEGYHPILASDGNALELLKKEFPQLTVLELPSYKIQYPENGEDFKWKMIKSLPKMLDAIAEEKKLVKKWVKEFDLCGIISDNRLGVYSKKVPSVFMTHQLNVLTGNTSWITTKMHQQIIKKFDECWVPDFENEPNLSGRLGHVENPDFYVKYLGPLSRFNKEERPKKYDLMVLLSGPEPQRTLLENRLKNEIQNCRKNTVFIRGKVQAKQEINQVGKVTYYNFMTTSELQHALNESELILCRSGYTTVMDLAKLQKSCFFIPTPGQYEQEYLAEKFEQEKLVPYSNQDDFKIEFLKDISSYSGLPTFTEELHWKNLFCLFQRE